MPDPVGPQPSGEPPPNPPPWGRRAGPPSFDRSPLDGAAHTSVVVVGAGITGLTAALELTRAGVDVRLFEHRHLAAGATGYTTAKVSVLQGTTLHRIARKWGDDVARAFVEANQAGMAWIRERVDEHGIGCDLEPRTAVTFARTPRGTRAVEEEVEVGARLGLDVRLDTEVGLPFPMTVAVALDDQFQFDPVAYLWRLAEAFVGAGGRLHEHTRVLGLDGDHRVVTDRGVVEADHVLVCTGIPFLDRSLEFARLEPVRSYCIAVRTVGELPRPMAISADQPTRSLRTMRDPDGVGELLVVGGEGHVVGREPDPPGRYEALEAWAREHVGATATAYRWSTQDYQPVDQLPHVGRPLGAPENVRIASGYAKWGMSKGTAAGLALAADVLGEPPAWLAPFDPRRNDALKAPKEIASLNGSVGWRLVTDRLKTLGQDVPELADGEAVVVRSGLVGRTGVSRVGGRTCVVAATCPHLGGTLAWNRAERSWDCPLHGSRFTAEGTLLQGPAVKDLEPRDVPTP